MAHSDLKEQGLNCRIMAISQQDICSKSIMDTFLRVALKGYRPWRAIGYRRGAQ